MPLPRLRSTAAVLAGVLLPGAVLMVGTGPAGAADADFGSAASFAVLAGSTITNTGPSVVRGDLGLSPGTAVTGFPPGTLVGGAMHVADAVALRAKNDARTAYTTAAGLPATQTISADLGGRTLVPGVYAGPTLGLTGTLSLDAGGNPAAEFVLRASSTLTTASASRVLLLNGANPCNVTWVVGSSAALGTASTFVGTVLAQASITATTNAQIQGRLFADSGAVTLDTNAVSRPVCTAAAVPAPVTSPAPTTAPTATPTASATPSRTPSGSPTASATPSRTPTGSPTTSASASASASATPSDTPTSSTAPSAPAPGGATPSASAVVVRPPTAGRNADSAAIDRRRPAARRGAAASSTVAQLPRTGTEGTRIALWGAVLTAAGAGLALAARTPATRERLLVARRRRP